MTQLTVYKLDENGQEVWQYPAVALERQPSFVRLEAFFNRNDLDTGYTTFKRGDRFVEYFYTDRWYNVFAVYDRDDSQLKGWYCNVCRPAVLGETAVYCQDLALDLWASAEGVSAEGVSAEGAIQVLDEDEFAALSLSPADRQSGQAALQMLLTLAQAGQLPQ